MPYNRCKQCKVRLGDSDSRMFCSVECDNIYSNSVEVFCKNCSSLLGKSSVTKKLFCNLTCSNNFQKKINTVERSCIQCFSKFLIKKSSKRKKLCSKECEKLYTSSVERNSKRMDSLKSSNLKKYGFEHIFSDRSIIEKSKKTKLEKYGNLNNFLKIKKTKLEKYGDEFFSNSDLSKKTKLEKYGSLDFNDKSKKTKLERYGTLDFSEKSNRTKLERYGTLDFSDKSNETIIRKYGSWSNFMCRKSYFRLKNKYADIVEFLFLESEYEGSVDYKKYKFKCKSCDSVFLDNMSNGTPPICNVCFPSRNVEQSVGELEVLSFIKKEYSGVVIEKDRSFLDGKELDIYLPEKKLAVEYNGVYWHGEVIGGRGRSYHLNKTKSCENSGIQLIHILDWEWLNKKDIVKSMLLNKIGKSSKLHARKCVIRNVSELDKSLFLEKNHIQGNDMSSIRVGLYYEDVLVSLMTFIKSRYDKNHEYELSRYCNVLNINVVGGASRLFNYIVNKYEISSVVTYSDKRLFTGLVYKNMNMKLIGSTSPGYHYFHKDKPIPVNRLNFQKHKLINVLEKFDENLSEWENMKNNGYDRIWDCGHLKYVWNKN